MTNISERVKRKLLNKPDILPSTITIRYEDDSYENIDLASNFTIPNSDQIKTIDEYVTYVKDILVCQDGIRRN